LAVFCSHLHIKLRDQAVRQVLLEDFSLLIDLFLMEIIDIVDFTLLSPLLHFACNESFLAHEIVLNLKKVFVKLSVNLSLLLLEFGNLRGLISPRNNSINAQFAVLGSLSEDLLLGYFLLHHGKDFFL